MLKILSKGLSWFFEKTKIKVLSFIINNTLRPYLKEKIHSNSLDAQLSSGLVVLQEVDLNEQVLNQRLLGLPFKVLGGYVEEIRIKIPWDNLLEQNTRIELKGVEFLVSVGGNLLSRQFLFSR